MHRGNQIVTRLGVRLLLSVLVLAMVPSAANASEASNSSSGKAEIRREPDLLPSSSVHRDRLGLGMWFLPEIGRGYQLSDWGSGLVAYDVDSRSQVGRTDLVPPAWFPTRAVEFTSGVGRPHLGAVDRDNQRIFLPYGSIAQDWVNPKRSGGVQQPCPHLDIQCMEGIHVIDGLSLASLGRIPLSPPTVEGLRAHFTVRMVTYAPPDAAMGWGGRVLVLVEDIAAGPVENSALPSVNTLVLNTVPRRNGGNIVYAIAFDPQTMRQEWIVRLDGCRNSREPRSWVRADETFPNAIFRVGGGEPALYVGCHATAAQQGAVVRVPLDARGVPATLPLSMGDPTRLDPQAGPAGVVRPAPRQEVFTGPDQVRMILADPISQRLLMRVEDAGEVWWVFDAKVNQFVGTVGIGGYRQGHTTAGLDPDIGRLYVEAGPVVGAPGGLYVTDIRRDPLPQAIHHPEFFIENAPPGRHPSGTTDVGGLTMNVMPRGDTGVTRLFVSKLREAQGGFAVLADTSPISGPPPVEATVLVRSLDIPETQGETVATFDGTARGFGFRTILIGGAEGATRAGQLDPIGWARGVPQFNYSLFDTEALGLNSLRGNELPKVLPRPDPCTDAQRELVLAFVGPRSSAVVDASSSRGEAQPVLVDVRTEDDVAAPVTRCAPKDWQSLWQAALVSRPPMGEPGVAWPFEDATSSCTATDQETSDSWSEPVLGMFASKVACSEGEVGGWGQARGVGLDGVSVANTLSSFRIYRDSARGMVARVESIARGVDVAGLVKIDTIRGVAESWANGRKAPEPTEEQKASGAFNPFNCDAQRPAGTCFQRHVFGVTVAKPDGGVAYRCGPCGPEEDFIDAMNRALGANGNARFREPDPELARGSADGFQAAITKKPTERFADIVLNNDLLETMVPMLEIVRNAPHNRPNDPKNGISFGTPPRGKQVYQFAAVEVSSTYGIQCLLVYDEASNTCAAETQQPGSVTVSLADADGRPLAGGAFEVRQDVDADGVLGLKDTLLPNGACVTADDGVGTCNFENLVPGPYVVSQVAAPPGYAKSAEPFVVELASGEVRTVAFTNVSNLSAIELQATDEAGAPLAGATFAAYPDPDADGKVAPDAKAAAECTTDAQGACGMQVPAGSYVLVQTSAPGGLEPIEPVAFTFASGGQVAAVGVVNYPPDSPQAPDAPASPVYTPGVVSAPPLESVEEGYVAPSTPTTTVEEPRVSLPEAVGGTVVRVIRAPGDALRLLSRDPKQAVAWTASLVLFLLASVAVRRRQLLGSLTATPVLAFTGSPPMAPPRRPTPPAGLGTRPRPQPHRPIAGGAPSSTERVHADVVVATASPTLAALARARLATDERVTLLATVHTWEDLREEVQRLRPDVLIVDLTVPASATDQVGAALAAMHRPDRVIALIPTGASVEEMGTQCVQAGLAGALAVDGDIDNGHLAFTVRQVAAGKPCYGPTVQAALGYAALAGPIRRKRGRPRITELTEREREVAELTADGVSRIDIAEQLCLSPWTVKRHLQTVRAKLGIVDSRDRDELRRRLDATAPDRGGAEVG